MEHDTAQLHLSELLEESLPPELKAGLEAHLATCAECRDSLALLERTLRAVRGLPRVEAPPQFASRLRRRAAQAGLLAARRRRRQGPAGMNFSSTMALAVVLAAVGALLVLVLLMQKQIALLVEEAPPPVLQLAQPAALQTLAEASWAVGGAVRADGRLVPPGSALGGASLEVDLELPAARWAEFRRAAGAVAGLTREAPRVGPDGLVHLLVALRPGS
ncbi:MAG TPA: anti-sigma factor [Myxococcota bacterium]|nr:anti-sigma factor [Myxococcota bacterium]HRY94990.1 anti-sigma factor [Myxococcota bacterium]HSA23331.1 anti-sigma factor [Myxococcota bacterium]